MKRILVLALALVSIAAAPSGSNSGGLELLKFQFPSHVSGPVTSKSDPIVQAVFLKYERRVQAITSDSLADDVLWLTAQISRDIAFAQRAPENPSNQLTSSQKHAYRQNASWLKQKLLPYVQRLAQFQRGR